MSKYTAVLVTVVAVIVAILFVWIVPIRFGSNRIDRIVAVAACAERLSGLKQARRETITAGELDRLLHDALKGHGLSVVNGLIVPPSAFGAVVVFKDDNGVTLACVNLKERNGYFVELSDFKPMSWAEIESNIGDKWSRYYWLVWASDTNASRGNSDGGE